MTTSNREQKRMSMKQVIGRWVIPAVFGVALAVVIQATHPSKALARQCPNVACSTFACSFEVNMKCRMVGGDCVEDTCGPGEE